MFELFRKNFFINTILLIPYAVVLRIHTFIWPDRYYYSYEGNNVLLEWIYAQVGSPLVQSIVATILIIGQAVYINRIYIRNRLPNEYTLFPGALFILFVSSNEYLVQLSPEIMGLTFVIIMISQMFKTYKNQKGSVHIFNTGFYACLAFLLNPGLVWVLLYGYIGLMILRSFKSNEQLQYLCGILTPIFLSVSVLYYIQADVWTLTKDFIDGFGLMDFGTILSVTQYVFLGLMGLLFIVVFFSYNLYTIRKTIQVQKKIDLFYWLSLISLLATVFTDHVSYSGLLLLIISICILCAMNLTWVKNRIYTEMLHLLWVAVIIYTFYI